MYILFLHLVYLYVCMYLYIVSSIVAVLYRCLSWTNKADKCSTRVSISQQRVSLKLCADKCNVRVGIYTYIDRYIFMYSIYIAYICMLCQLIFVLLLQQNWRLKIVLIFSVCATWKLIRRFCHMCNVPFPPLYPSLCVFPLWLSVCLPGLMISFAYGKRQQQQRQLIEGVGGPFVAGNRESLTEIWENMLLLIKAQSCAEIGRAYS